jgi:hypothetical protein
VAMAMVLGLGSSVAGSPWPAWVQLWFAEVVTA